MRNPFMVEFSGTPEAGKTTTIRNVANKLSGEGYKVSILKESAERLPKEIPKGTFDANLWMHLQTQSGILMAKYQDADIVLIDRGLIDSLFYGEKFLKEGICTKEQYKNFKELFINELFPNLFIALMVEPKVAIQRRGGVGRLVNEEYIKRYNSIFQSYYSSITSVPKEIIDTTKYNVYEMNDKIFDTIRRNLP